MTTATSGTGTITLVAAVTGALSFASAGIADGDIVTYAIEDGSNSEIGRGTYTASGTTLTRTVLKSTNSNAAINLSGSAEVFLTPSAEDLLFMAQPGGRLTLTADTPVMTATASAQTTVRYEPWLNRFMPLYDGVSYTMHDFGGALTQATTDTTKSPAACTTNSNYDVFGWLDGTTYRATRGPVWSSDTARGTGAGTTELERVKGILLNKVAITNGPAANRGTFLGTFRTNGTSTVDWIYGALAAGGTAGFFGVWNMYNRVNVSTTVQSSTDNWTYATTAWRAPNGSSTYRVSYVCGLAEDSVVAAYQLIGFSDVLGNAQASGIGVDSTTAFTGMTGYYNQAQAGGHFGRYDGMPGIGFHYLSALEYRSAGTQTFLGDGGTPTWTQSGLSFTGRF